MKTNANIVRKLNDFDVVQRTKDSMFDATTLLKQWNKSSGMKKEIKHFFENKQTKEFIEVLLNEEKLNTRNSAYLKSRGKNGGTWMHPYLFIKFAMWLNPKFEYHVIKFVYDELIQHRKLSGDFYNKLCSLLGRFKETDFREVGKILNFVVFNEHARDRRNSATPEQQEDLQQLERDACRDIEKGYVRSWDEFKTMMRREWATRHNNVPSVLT
ncbi:KilA-N domain-containing protein [Sphingobacterium griseoflavum]|uniref:KilA-N domain-containing protein n=1 Tax=Sphingobacterium griseoflavum TaxID=1474952 RepID=A0ABQ3HX97_9SPHI|nr:KilA-N domain-containing protein [Sphingobacterium griseoflavum]GHE35158.1 hypothetical protein GCM10017764_18000 [Sphingobacterium griseoflavum]